MQRDPATSDVVDEVKAFLAERLGVRGGAPASPSERIAARSRGSASARPSSTTSSCSRACDELAALGPPDPDRHLAQELPRGRLPAPRRRSRSRPIAAARDDRHQRDRASSAARACSASTRSRRCATPWRVAAATLGGDGRRGAGEDRRGAGATTSSRARRRSRGGGESVTIEISGLSLYTHHGVSAAEREVGQRLVIDMRLDVGETRCHRDRLASRTPSTTPRSASCRAARPAALSQDARAAVQHDRRPAARPTSSCEGVWVKAAKPEPPIALTVEEVSVEVWRERTVRVPGARLTGADG